MQVEPFTAFSENEGKAELPMPESDLSSDVEVESSFSNSSEIQEFVSQALDKFSQSSDQQKFLERVGGKEGLQELISNKDGDLLTKVAGLANDAGIEDPKAIGRITHRVAEIDTLMNHSDEVLDGTRLAEHRVDYEDEHDNKKRIEIDNVFQRQRYHNLRDFKPINVKDFEKTENGKQWVGWMEENVGNDFRERLSSGENPFVVARHKSMPKDIRDGLRDFMKDARNAHQDQLDNYKKIYVEANNLDPAKVRTQVRPYFVYR